jgi:hypothetical protein
MFFSVAAWTWIRTAPGTHAEGTWCRLHVGEIKVGGSSDIYHLLQSRKMNAGQHNLYSKTWPSTLCMHAFYVQGAFGLYTGPFAAAQNAINDCTVHGEIGATSCSGKIYCSRMDVGVFVDTLTLCYVTPCFALITDCSSVRMTYLRVKK